MRTNFGFLIAGLFLSLSMNVLGADAGSPGTGALSDNVSLVEAVRYALGHAHEIGIAGSDAAIAREGRTRARAGTLPRVDADAGLTLLSEQPGAIINGNAVNTADRDIFGLRVTAEQTLYDFGRTRSRVDQADARSEAAEDSSSLARERQAIDVIGAFLAARRAAELLGVAEDSLRLANEHRKVAGDLFDAGSVAKNDVLAADVSVANAEAALVAARNRTELACSRLSLRMGLSGDREVCPAPGDFPVPLSAAPSLFDSVRLALLQRKEVKSQESLVQEGEATVRAADAEFGPTVFGRGGYQYDSNGYNPNHNVFSFLLGGRINLFAGNADVASRQQARHLVSRRKSELASLKDNLALDVKAAHLALDEAGRRKDAADRAVAAATENLRIQDDRYREGLSISTEQTEAQSLLTRAVTDQRNSQYDIYEARYRLLYTRGELMDYLAPIMASPAP